MDGWSSVDEICEVPSLDLKLRMQSPGGISGSVTCALPRLHAEIRIALGPTGEELRPVGRVAFPPDSNTGTFELSGLRPGEYDLEVLVGTFVACRANNILIEEARIARSSELESLYVGPEFEWGEIVVRDKGGLPIAGARVQLRDRRQSETPLHVTLARTASTNHEGKTEFPLEQSSQLALTIQARGFADTHILAPRFPLSVQLSRGVEVRVLLSEPIPSILPVDWFRIYVVPQDGDAPDSAAATAWPTQLIKAGTTELSVKDLGTGEYSVWLKPVPAGAAEDRRRLAALKPKVMGSFRITEGLRDGSEVPMRIDSELIRAMASPR
jgi:hypothetical protein